MADRIQIERKQALVDTHIRACGSSIANRKCIYGEKIEHGVPVCEARDKVRNACPFKANATVQTWGTKHVLRRERLT